MELKKAGSASKSIATKVLDILIDYDSDIKDYNNAIEDYNTLGGIDGIAETMGWDESQKHHWSKRIQAVNSIK